MAGSEGIGSSGAQKRNREPGIRTPVRRRRPGSRIDSPPPALAGPQAGGVSRARRWLSKIVSSWGPSPTFRIFLFLGGIVATMGFFLYNEYVIDQLRRQERKQGRPLRQPLRSGLVPPPARGLLRTDLEHGNLQPGNRLPDNRHRSPGRSRVGEREGPSRGRRHVRSCYRPPSTDPRADGCPP